MISMTRICRNRWVWPTGRLLLKTKANRYAPTIPSTLPMAAPMRRLQVYPAQLPLKQNNDKADASSDRGIHLCGQVEGFNYKTGKSNDCYE